MNLVSKNQTTKERDNNAGNSIIDSMKLTMEQVPEAVRLLLEKVETLQNVLARIELQSSRQQLETGLIDTTQAADCLNVSRDTILKMVSSSEIPSYKIGQKVCFKPDELNEWLNTKRRKSVKEIQAEAENYKKQKRR